MPCCDQSVVSVGQRARTMRLEFVAGDDFLDGSAGPPFSMLQIVGLICCTLFLLTAALVMIDLVWSIRAPAGVPISSPLLKALTDLFSWR